MRCCLEQGLGLLHFQYASVTSAYEQFDQLALINWL
jgi:hypothetical protein